MGSLKLCTPVSSPTPTPTPPSPPFPPPVCFPPSTTTRDAVVKGKAPTVLALGAPGKVPTAVSGRSHGTAASDIAAEIQRRTGVTLFSHQINAIQWMQRTERRPRMVSEQPHGGILAHEMGLGKTITCLCAILLEGLGSTIIVCPKSVITQWRDEAVRILGIPATSVVLYHGATRHAALGAVSERGDAARRVPAHRLVLTTFDMVRMDTRTTNGRACRLHAEHWDRVVLDEAHRICEQNSKTARAIHSLRARNRWCITGTPFKNGVTDLVALSKFLLVPPYCNSTWWRSNSNNPHKIREWRHVFLNLQNKTVLSLPPIVYENRVAAPSVPEQHVISQIQNLCVTGCHGAGAMVSKSSPSAPTAAGVVGLVKAVALDVAVPRPHGHRSYVDPRVSVSSSSGDGFLYRKMPHFLNRRSDLPEFPVDDEAALLSLSAIVPLDDFEGAGGVGLASTTRRHADHINGGVGVGVGCSKGAVDAFTLTRDRVRATVPARQEYELLRIIRLRQAANHPLLLLNSTRAIIRLATVETTFGASTDGPPARGTSPHSKLQVCDACADVVPPPPPDSDTSSTDGAWRPPATTTTTVVPDDVFVKKRKLDGGENENFAVVDRIGTGWAGTAPAEAVAPPRSLEAATCDHVLCAECSDDMILCPCCLTAELPVTRHARDETRVWRHSAKTRELSRYLQEVFKLDPAAKVVLFSQWTTCLDLLAELLRFLDLGFARFDGRVNSLEERSDVITYFKNNDGCQVLLTSLGAGGEGLNLTFANHVILMEPYWNLAVEQQAIDRLHRIGQCRVTHVLRMYLKDSIESWVQDIQQKKQTELKRLLGSDDERAEHEGGSDVSSTSVTAPRVAAEADVERAIVRALGRRAGGGVREGKGAGTGGGAGSTSHPASQGVHPPHGSVAVTSRLLAANPSLDGVARRPGASAWIERRHVLRGAAVTSRNGFPSPERGSRKNVHVRPDGPGVPGVPGVVGGSGGGAGGDGGGLFKYLSV